MLWTQKLDYSCKTNVNVSSSTLLSVSGTGIPSSDTTGESLTPQHRPSLEPHPEGCQKMLTNPLNGPGSRYHSKGHIWSRFPLLGLIWQISTTNFLSRFVWSQDLVQAKCFALFVYLGYVFGCLAGKKKKAIADECLLCSFQISFWQLDKKGMPPQRRDRWGKVEVMLNGSSSAVHRTCHRCDQWTSPRRDSQTSVSSTHDNYIWACIWF